MFYFQDENFRSNLRDRKRRENLLKQWRRARNLTFACQFLVPGIFLVYGYIRNHIELDLILWLAVYILILFQRADQMCNLIVAHSVLEESRESSAAHPTVPQTVLR
ncbi:MAG: hypothetical protein KDN20_26530 [Verrucomicrobiae bacterium]|nr:hypothetical protein [Verrucomicrobiae bacterium]